MGQFTKIEIQIEYEKETVGEAVVETISNFREMVKKHILKNDEPFDSNIVSVSDCGQIEIELNSGRKENAEWQLNAIIKILQQEKIFPAQFNADKNSVPMISMDIEDFVNFETGL